MKIENLIFLKIDRGILRFCLIGFLVIFSLGVKAQVIDTLHATDDASISIQLNTSNYGGAADLRSHPHYDGYYWRFLVRFDLSSIPSGATIDSAVINLYYQSGVSTTTIDVHRATAFWEEDSVTWNSFSNSFYSTKTDSSDFNWSLGQLDGHWDVTSDVQDMVDGTYSNYGWLFKDDNDIDVYQPYFYFHSKDGTGAVPELVVKYTSVTAPTVTVPEDTVTICLGDTVQLTVSGADSYSWTPTSSLSDSIGDTVLAYPTVPTTYQVIGTTSGLSDTATVHVKFHTVGAANVSVIYSNTYEHLCPADSAILTATGGASYVWSPSTGLNTTTGSQVVVSSISDDVTYVVSAIDSNGCSMLSPTVTVYRGHSGGTTFIGNDTTICKGDSLTLTSVYNMFGYYWLPDGQNTQSIVVKDSGDYELRITTTDVEPSCPLIGKIRINLYDLPIVTVSPELDTIAFGDSLLLTASGAELYGWNPTSSLSLDSGTTVYASPLNNTTYTVEGTDSLGCRNDTTATVVVIFPPSIEQKEFAKLVRKLDKNYWETSDNELNFLYAQEYNLTSDTLEYKIYDGSRNVVVDKTDYALNVEKGLNKLSIPCIYEKVGAQGYFILEVKNIKNESWFLRFKVEASGGCN